MKGDTERHFRRHVTRTIIDRKKYELMRRRKRKLVKRREDKLWLKKNNIKTPVTKETLCSSESETLTLQDEKNNLLPLLEDPDSVNIPLVDRLDSYYEFQLIQNLFSKSSHLFEVTGMLKVKNPHLRFQYELKKNQAMWKYGSILEMLLFHGTHKDNITSICQNNFDWRLCKKHKYGIGVNFATTSSYAAHYCDEDTDKVMIISRVLIGNSCYWSESMPWPPKPYDTVISQNGCVVVKFEDHTYYPQYLVYFRRI